MHQPMHSLVHYITSVSHYANNVEDMTSIAGSKRLEFQYAFVQAWESSVSNYHTLAALPPHDDKMFAESAENIIKQVIERLPQENKKFSTAIKADEIFIEAVRSAETHISILNIISPIRLEHKHSVVANRIAVLLRCADAIDKVLSNSMAGNSFSKPSAFIFGAIHTLVVVAMESVKSFRAINERLKKLNHSLQRLDFVWFNEYPTESHLSILVHVLICLVQFCGLATKYFQGMYDLIRC